MAELFEMPFEEKIWKREWLVEGGREGLWDRLRTLSYLKNLEGKVRAVSMFPPEFLRYTLPCMAFSQIR